MRPFERLFIFLTTHKKYNINLSYSINLLFWLPSNRMMWGTHFVGAHHLTLGIGENQPIKRILLILGMTNEAAKY